jgi:hypothetical protein
MHTITEKTVVVRAEGLLVSTVNDELVMVSLARGYYYGLDNAGVEIWKQLATPLSVAELCERLTRRYDVALESCRADVLRFLQELQAEQMIQVVNP